MIYVQCMCNSLCICWHIHLICTGHLLCVWFARHIILSVSGLLEVEYILYTLPCFACIDLFTDVVQGTLDVDSLTEAHLCAVNASLHTLLSLAVECNKPCIVEKLLGKGLSQKTKDFRATEVCRAVHIVTVVLLAATAFVLFI